MIESMTGSPPVSGGPWIGRLAPAFTPSASGSLAIFIARIARGKKVSLTFDNDYHENPAVIRQLAKLISTISESDDPKISVKNVAILAWERNHKGIDDALFNAVKIVELSFDDWIWNLPTENRKLIDQAFI